MEIRNAQQQRAAFGNPGFIDRSDWSQVQSHFSAGQQSAVVEHEKLRDIAGEGELCAQLSEPLPVFVAPERENNHLALVRHSSALPNFVTPLEREGGDI